MQDWKEFGRKILFPPIWLIMILTVISTIALVAIFVKGWETNPVVCICYVIAFYTLTVICMFCWKVLPGCYRVIKAKLHENQYANRYLTDVVYKTEIGLYRSLVINLIYVAVNAVAGIIYKTYWFGIFAVYYGMIAIMRFLLVRYVGKNTIGNNHVGELKRARLCALILLTVNLTLSGADTSSEVKQIMIMATGAGISVAVVAMAFYVIIQSSKEIKQYQCREGVI